MCQNITDTFFENVLSEYFFVFVQCVCNYQVSSIPKKIQWMCNTVLVVYIQIRIPVIAKCSKDYTYCQYQPWRTQCSLTKYHCTQNSCRHYYRRAYDICKT